MLIPVRVVSTTQRNALRTPGGSVGLRITQFLGCRSAVVGSSVGKRGYPLKLWVPATILLANFVHCLARQSKSQGLVWGAAPEVFFCAAGLLEFDPFVVSGLWRI